MGNKLTPVIRFKGFTEDWEQRKVSEITLFHKQGYYTKEPYDESKKYYLLRGTEMTSNKIILKDTPKINATEKDYQDFKVQKGDFLIVRSGTVGTYGIVYDDIKAIFGSYLINFRFNTEIVTNEFFGLFYQSQKFRYQLNKIIQQSSNVNINAENIKSTVIDFPKIEEQQKIGAFFKSLDDTIDLQERKLELLKIQKKGYLQKMFPKQNEKVPELRFKGFNDTWEQRKFKDLVDSKDGIRRGPFGSALKKDLFVKESEYVVYEQQNAIYDRFDTRYNITEEKYNELIKFKVEPGDFIMSGAGTIGRISMVPNSIKSGVFNQALIRFRLNHDKTDSKYFLQLMRSETMQRKLTESNPGSAMVNLVPMSEVKEWDILVPNISEQRLLGEFFTILDDTIDLQECKLNTG